MDCQKTPRTLRPTYPHNQHQALLETVVSEHPFSEVCRTWSSTGASNHQLKVACCIPFQCLQPPDRPDTRSDVPIALLPLPNLSKARVPVANVVRSERNHAVSSPCRETCSPPSSIW